MLIDRQLRFSSAQSIAQVAGTYASTDQFDLGGASARQIGSGRTVIYMNRQVLTWVERQTAVKSTMNFTPTDWHGRKILSFRGIPIVTCDALDTTEAVVA